MEKGTYLKPGWVVQLVECEDIRYLNCFMILDKAYPWGATGYIYAPCKDPKRPIPPSEVTYRAEWYEMALISKSDNL